VGIVCSIILIYLIHLKFFLLLFMSCELWDTTIFHFVKIKSHIRWIDYESVCVESHIAVGETNL
jgi:hypothetical protein